MTLSILEFAGTFELRETMIISLFDKLNSKRWIANSFGLLLCTLFAHTGHAFEIGNPTGVQQIGRALDLQSSVSGIPAGAESQLRSTCLRARASPKVREGQDAFEGQGNDDLLVDFVPTIRQGGLIQFKSRSPVKDAVLELELISDCPLLAFKTSWMLIVEPEQPGSEQMDLAVQTPQGRAGFDLANSTLLKASRVVPKRTVLAAVAPQSKVESQTGPVKAEQASSGNLSQPSGTAAEIHAEASMQNAPVQETLELAALQPGFSDQGLIESRPSKTTLAPALTQENMPLLMDFNLSSPSLWVFIVSTLLLLAALIALIKSRLKQTPASKTGWGKVEPGSAVPGGVFKSHSGNLDLDLESTATVPNVEQSTAHNSDRVLESLMGNAEQTRDEAADSLKPLTSMEALESHHRTSLSICLELVNKADIRVWNLPGAYQDLVESRNKSLGLHRTVDALLLRCQVGLVELAFQEARKNRRLPDDMAHELLKVVIGEHAFDLESTPALCVPDVVKSHVRAKMCEISGAEKRQLLQENLLNLNSQVPDQSLCFSSDGWREFLSEEGILE